ncbi:golgin subfamily B member 1-like [Melanotaenia boesemani]|uniref:golgin subfamily B member 1-like n=1 Tax=Melanotaenia boesemani TaxID=1250792 RepID=UPI001C049BD9|nr:golgin subfamily B member 1-like [Melanotaenia boesemani]
MLKWFSGEEGEPGSGGPGSPHGAAGGETVAVEEMAERLTQTEQLVSQLKEMIREKDSALRSKDDQLKVEKEACEAKLSKLRLQNKAKVTSLTTQLEELKKRHGDPGTPTHGKKGSSEGDQASRGKIVLLKRKVEELEQQLAQRDEELENKRRELESQLQRGEEMDAMLTEKDKRLTEKEAYIVHLQMGLAGGQPITPAPHLQVELDGGAKEELQLLVQSLTKKVGEAEERYSLLQEETDSLKELLASEKAQYSQKESMFKQNIQTFKDIIIQKDNQLMEISKMHEQELFKLAAKSDASADLEQLLKALKQKLHEKEEVLLGKTQVIDVLQGEVDGRDQQIKELTERLRRLQVERESLESKMEAEKHVMRAQLRDLMEKQQVEVQRMTEQHQAQMDQIQQDLLGQLEELRRASLTAPPASQEASGSGNLPTDSASIQRIAELEAQAKQKTEEASRSEAKFLKMKAWSKSRIRQLEDELKKSQAGAAPPDLMALRSQITALEEEREENQWRVEQYQELKAKNEMLEAKLVLYEEQQRTLQADLEQFTKRAASQASESGSADDTQSQVLEWQEMVAEAVSARDRAREEKAAMALRISHMEEEREALATRQQELEDELAQARGLGHHRAKKLAAPAQRSLQEDFEFDGQAPFQDPRSASESTTPMEGENMGDGLRSVVEELELERNQLQEQILSLEERCQDLEDRLQLQARIEALQNESERLQSQLASVRSQQGRDAEKHQLLVNSLNEKLKGLSETQECLESSLIEKENTLAKTSEKLELISSLRESLSEKEMQYKELLDRLLQAEHSLENMAMKCSGSEKQCSELKTEAADLTQKLSLLKEKAQKQEVTIETLQTELDQTNEDLDKLNTTHLEERAQLIHDLQSCEREIDSLKDILSEKDKEMSSLAANMAEYAEQLTILKQEIKVKEESLVQVEKALSKAEREAMVIRDSQSSDQQTLNSKITELVGKLKDTEVELVNVKEERESKVAEVEHLIKQTEEDKRTIQELRGEIQKQIVSHRNHLSECEIHISSLKEQVTSSAQKLQESEELVSHLKDRNASNEKLQQELREKEQLRENELKSFKEEQNELLAQVEKYNNQVQTLSKQLEKQMESEENVRKTMQEKLETLASLEDKLKAADKQAEDERHKFNMELQVRDSETQKLSKELKNKSENFSKLKSLLKSTKTEKQQLEENLKGLNEELDLQKQQTRELNEKVASALELNSSLQNQVQQLTEQKERLEVEVTQRTETISEVTAELGSLQAKIAALETQHSENKKIIQQLHGEKEELTVRTSELNQVFEQSTHSNSEILLAKTNECSHLNQLLREREEEVAQLREYVQSLTSKVEQLQLDVAEKEQATSGLLTEKEVKQKEQTQLEETLSLLREQESSLKAGLMEKDALLNQKHEEYQSLQNEITAQKNTTSKLRAEAESLHEERSHLQQRLEEREEMLKKTTQQSQMCKDELNERNEAVKSLSDQIRVLEENSRKFESEAAVMKSELAELHATCESREKQLTQQLQAVSDLNSQLAAAVEQNSSLSEQISSLTEDNQRLQEELAKKVKSVSELMTEKSLLQEITSRLEIQISDNQKMMDDLLREKEELTLTAEELKKILKESEQSSSAGLLEKTNQCAHLSKALRGKEEQLQSLQEQISELNTSLHDKEKVVEAQQNQLMQLQDTISMLQEQGSVLKSGLMEKDVMFQQKADEAEQQKDLVSKMQGEIESLRQQCLGAKQQIEEKEEALRGIMNEFQNQKDELNKRNESVISLSGQLGAMNENAAKMEAEITNLKESVQKLSAENHWLMQEEGQRKADIIDFKDNIQALNEQNTRIKSELQKTLTELSEAHELITNLRAEAREKERLNLSVQGKDDALKQQETLIQQLNITVSEQKEQLEQRAEDTLALQGRVSELEGQVDSLTAELCILKNTLDKSKQSSLEYQAQSSATVESLSSHLQAKEAECESLKEQISHLKESVTKLSDSLQVQKSEAQSLRKVLEDKEAALLERSKSLEDVQRQADEASLFKTQFMESTELVTQLQSQIQLLCTQSENLKKSEDETQSAFNNLQEKYAANLEELQDVRSQLSERTEQVSTLQTLLDESQKEEQTLRKDKELSEALNCRLSQEKDEAFASHQASVSLLTVEIERLKSQHLQVATQMNALTENLEQREMALHAINSQYTAQAKHTTQLVSEIKKLEEQNKRLNEEIRSSKEEVGNENAHLQGEVRKLVAEKEELERRYCDVQTSQEELQAQMEQRSSSIKEMMEKMESEKQNLQAEVSAKDEEISRLKENVQKIEQILQDSEREWLLVLDREKQHKNLLSEQLRSVENEMKTKDVKVNALKQDLDSLQEKLADASAAVRQGSDQLSAKELEASTSRIQLEKVLAAILEKEEESRSLQEALKAAEDELLSLVMRENGSHSDSSAPQRSAALNTEKSNLRDMIRQLQESHQAEVRVLKGELDRHVAQLQENLNEGERSNEKSQQITRLLETVETLQTRLNAAEEKVKEASVGCTSSHSELKAKEEQIGCMSIQISQQKELLAALSQQLKDKDASIAQVIESASSERMKLDEEKGSLLTQLENMEQAQQTTTKRLGEISQQLEEQMLLSQSEMERKNSENLQLLKEKADLQSELAKASKEKEAMKKKLQAALLVRKDLTKRVEEYEKQRDESLNNAEQSQATVQRYQERVSLLEKEILQKNGEILEAKAERERVVEQLETLRSTLNEKEACLWEKDSVIEQLQQRLEELQSENQTCKAELEDKSSSTASSVDLENELAQVKLEKATLQKKAQAALLARKEMMKKAQENEKKLSQELAELKDDYKALLEQRCQQTNELNAVQLTLDQKVRELENLHKTSLSHLDELNTLRHLVGERDKTLQDLKMSLAEKESQCHSLSNMQTELENVKSMMESVSSETVSKDEALREMHQREDALKSELHSAQKELEMAHAELEQKTDEMVKCQETIRLADRELQASCEKNSALEAQLDICQSEVEQEKLANEKKNQILTAEKEAFVEQMNLLKLELESAIDSVSQKSFENSTIQRMFAETQQQLGEELEKAQLRYTETQRELDSLKRVKENSELRDEVAAPNQPHKHLHEDKHQDDVCNSCKHAENIMVKLKERDDALSGFQAQVSEKEALIAALELQLQQQIKMHEVTLENMKAEAEGLQKSQEDGSRTNDQDSKSKVALLTKKLQAALVSRKQLLKENSTLREEVENLSARRDAKEAECSDLGSSVLKLKEQNVELERSSSSASKERDQLSSEIECVLGENRSLSAACDSLKLTIENITQQKQAFSCQLESLKDSQTEELTRWKSKHVELKQEYESLLQAYENVSSEMDKMRQLLEGAKRDRQDALRKLHSREAEVVDLEKQAREAEEENGRLKERMHKFTKEKRQKMEELEDENQRIKKELMELSGNHNRYLSELRDKNQQLEAEMCQLRESSEDLRGRLAVIQAENGQLAQKLEATSRSLEERSLESNTYANNMQLKLDESLSLNNSLTAQIEAQKTELGAQLEIGDLLQKEKQNLSERIENIQNDHEVQLGKKDDAIKELKDIINKHSQETVSLNEKVRILEDDKTLLQEELENAQEISDKVKNENEYLETVILKNSERIDELTESINALQAQNTQLSAQLRASTDTTDRVRREKEQEQLKLVREFEEKLKNVQRGSEGSKNVRRELQELLKEKHQEINQLQQNCIRYQEVILDLESSSKGLQSACEQLEKDLKTSSEKISTLEERSKEVEAELTGQRKLLQEAEEKMVMVESERDQLAAEVSQHKHSETTDGRKPAENPDQTQLDSYFKSQFVLQQQIDELKNLKDKESQRVDELMQQLDHQDLQINTLKRAAESNKTKLSALSAAPEGADASKLWNDLYQKSLHEKDNQLLEQGFMITRFLEDMRRKDKEVNELRVTKSRLERTLNEYSVAAAAQQRQLFVMGATNAELSETAELMTAQVKELAAQVDRKEQEKNALNHQLANKEDAVSELQLHLQQMEKINADTDAQLRLLQTRYDRVQADFEKQEGISLQLKTLLQNKDAEISSLLSCRDGQMSGYLEQLQANHRSQVSVYEDRLTSLRYQRDKADTELRTLEAKLKSLQIQVNRSVQEKEQTAAKIESFKNSMVSLQSERERLISEYRILEVKSQLSLKGKEGSPDGETGANKGLKHEIRKLLHQMDDLNSENAMLRAQLVRYREDLNQVLSLKDNQLKVLLRKQQDVIKNLENQKAAAEKQHRESQLELQREEETSNALETQNSKLKAQVSKLEAEILILNEKRAATSEGRVIADLQEAVAAKAAECNDLQQKLLSHKILANELKDEMQQLGNERDKKLAEAEDGYNRELKKFEREVELMRNERETADRRVAELAKELLDLEQQLSVAKLQNKEMKAQNESLCKAMAALQNDRDQLIQDFKVLRNRYDEELRETRTALNKTERSLQDASSDSAMFAKERDILVHRLKAVESKDVHAELNTLLDEVSKALTEKERELKQVVGEKNSCSRQLSAFSRSMASLQNDRDRLMEELAGTKRAVQSRQGSSLESVFTTEKGGGVLESQEDGLVRRLKAEELQHKEVNSYQEEAPETGSEVEKKEPPPVKQETSAAQSGLEETVSRMEAERMQLHRDLQRCIYEIQQRDQYLQQINTKLQQAVEERGSVAAQLRAVSQTLRDTQNRCHWLESQIQGQAQGAVFTEVAPGAPQERSNDSMIPETAEASQLRERLLEMELSLAEERARRETTEEALRLAEDRAKSVSSGLSRDAQRDFSIEMETEEEWEALSLNPNQPLITRKVKGGVVACRRWLRGRSLYFSRLLTGRARSRYFFLAYLLTLHVLVLMCLAGAL